jgi:type II secretory pathway pseudopilin PulG
MVDDPSLNDSMIRFMTPRNQNRRRSERGYILLTLILAVALSAIFALTWVQKVEFQIKRDREEELIHRGVQYSRAVRRYFKKFRRYPTRIEELENTNNLRFLRKRYKDPITGKDFKPLRITDVQMSFNSGGVNGLTPVSQMNAQRTGQLNSPFTRQAGTAGTTGPGTAATAGNSGDAADASSVPSDVSHGNQTVSQDAASQDNASQNNASQNNASNGPASPPPAGLASAPQVFGGGGIVGVASISKEKTIREFNKKDHYNQWQFIYDPSSDRGGLLMTPNQPPLLGAVQANQQQQQQNGQPGNQGQSFGLGNNGGMSPQSPAPQQPQQNPQEPEQQ